jgi:integrase
MPSVFRKSIVRHKLNGKQVPAGTPGAEKTTEKSRKFYGRVGHQVVPLSANRAAAQMMLNDLVRKRELRKAGVYDIFEEHSKRPLAEHAEDFRKELSSRGSTPRHVAGVLMRLGTILRECQFVFAKDLSASKVADFLAHRRQSGDIATPLDIEWLPVRDVARMLGIRIDSLRDLVARHRLQVQGHTHRRQLHRSAVEFLLERRGQGQSVETSNQYLVSIKAFARWLVQDGRMQVNPLLRLSKGRVDVDKRHARRDLSEDEIRRLLAVAQESTRVFRGLTGRDRFVLYAVAVVTGFRAGALASLTPASFDLDGDVPTVTLTAGANKSRILKVQPLPPDVAELVRDYLRSGPLRVERPLWPGTWVKRAADMLRVDLEAAGIAYSVPGPEGEQYADFHSLRHSALTLAGKKGTDFRTLQLFAGHSDPRLTARYSHRSLVDLAGAAANLSGLLPEFSCTKGVASAAAEGDFVPGNAKAKRGTTVHESGHKPRENKGKCG